MKILYITTVSSTMNAFFKPHIEMLFNEGHQVDLAFNELDWPIDEFYKKLGCKLNNIDFSRSPLSLNNIKAYKQLKKVIENGNYDIVHCHTPAASAITRLVCRKLRKKNGLKVFYTAHGFHFYKGAPKLNWLIYYPVEKLCSYFTDKLLVINKEDYETAKKKFKAKEVCYVPGVGIDLSRFDEVQVDRDAKREEIGVPKDAVLLTSVGELIERKNQKLIIQALAKINNEKMHYVIVGNGIMEDELKNYAKELNVENRVHLLGYRKDVAQILKASDVSCLSSFHEGLPVSLMEAMACGLPIVCSRVRGTVDLVEEDGGMLFDYHSIDDCCQAINNVLNSDMKRMGEFNKELVKNYSIDKIVKILKTLYES